MNEAEWLSCTNPQKMLEFLRGKASKRKTVTGRRGCCGSPGDTMTEQEWLACDDPSLMLQSVAQRVSARKVRLALCGCLRAPEIWPLLTAPASRRAVEVGEAFADGAANSEQLGLAQRKANAVAEREWRKRPSNPPAAPLATYVCLRDNGLLSFLHIPIRYVQQLRLRAGLLRDLFGDPFRPATITPAILAWNDATVVRLAQVAYDERHLPSGTLDNGRLLVLADALEESGYCGDARVLEHLRGVGPHVRGCWVVDLLLGKA